MAPTKLLVKIGTELFHNSKITIGSEVLQVGTAVAIVLSAGVILTTAPVSAAVAGAVSLSAFMLISISGGPIVDRSMVFRTTRHVERVLQLESGF
jgi:hypothetical protein